MHPDHLHHHCRPHSGSFLSGKQPAATFCRCGIQHLHVHADSNHRLSESLLPVSSQRVPFRFRHKHRLQVHPQYALRRYVRNSSVPVWSALRRTESLPVTDRSLHPSCREVALPVCRPGLFRYKSLRSLPVLL